MEKTELRGILIAAGFVFVTVAGQTAITRAMPSAWTVPLSTSTGILIIHIPLAVLTFFAARKITLSIVLFGCVALAVSFGTFAIVFGARGHNGSFDVPFLFAVLYTITFLSGFLGNEVWQYWT